MKENMAKKKENMAKMWKALITHVLHDKTANFLIFIFKSENERNPYIRFSMK